MRQYSLDNSEWRRVADDLPTPGELVEVYDLLLGRRRMVWNGRAWAHPDPTAPANLLVNVFVDMWRPVPLCVSEVHHD